jgi:NAD(P)-dependent dehydrogenase (short-subunit alcohol dehydrogenase family)
MTGKPAPEIRFDGQVVVVTGGARGMGLAHSKLLASRGAKIVVNDLGTESFHGGSASASVAETAAAAIRDGGGEAIASSDDIASPEGATGAIGAAIREWGRVDAVLHNAALGSFTSIADLEVEEYHRVRAVSLDGAFYLTQAAWPHMVEQHSGRFLYITSTSGLMGGANLSAYAAAKTGLIGLANVVRLEGEAHNITANLLGVAAYTRMTASMFSTNAVGHEALEDWWKVYMRPELVAVPAAWLLHPDCPASGEIFDTKGGHIERIFLASTRGYSNINPTIENVRDNWHRVEDQQGYRVYRTDWESAEAQFEDLVAAGASPLPRA